MNKNATIWFDVTSMRTWNRPAVGIIRVETKCAAYFKKADLPNLRFCRFDKYKNIYSEVPDEEVASILKRIEENDDFPPCMINPTLGKEKNFPRITKKFLRKILRIIKHSFGITIPRKYIEKFWATVRAFRRFQKKLSSFSNKPSSLANQSEEIITFKKGDIYISVGIDWEDKDLEFLYALKQNIDLKILLFCYDIIPFIFPHIYPSNLYMHHFVNLAWCADEVICISECSKKDYTELLNKIGAPIPSIKVVRLGCELPKNTGQELSPEVVKLHEKRFILFVSSIDRRKNHEILYRSYLRLLEKGKKDLPLLVFVGMLPSSIIEILNDLQNDLKIKPYVHILNHVSDNDLLFLYKNSEFTVYPSLYEGWGLPIAESLSLGKFCIASNVSSIPEVGGDLVEYIDPWDLPTWTDRLEWYFDHPEEVRKKEKIISAEFRSPSWDETASFILDAAKNL